MTIDGEEKILANAAATITESNNMKITAPDGTVSYAKTVTIDGCDNCVKTAVSELEDLGFTPEVR